MTQKITAQLLKGGLTVDASGHITATRLHGTLTGNVTGDVTGDLTGNADTATTATTADSADTLNQQTSINLSGTYSTHQLLVADAYALTGDVTINDNLILGKLSDDGNDILIEGNYTFTTTGAGKIEAGYISSSGISADSLTGTLGSGVSIGSEVTGTLGSGVSFPTGKFIPLKGQAHADGATDKSGSNVDMISLSLDLAGYEGYTLFAWCHTAITENANTGNTSRIRAKLNNGSSTTYFASARQGMGVYSSSTFDTNSTSHLSCQGYFVVTNAYATTCTLYMNGGIDGSAFSWGDQGSYTNFDNETPKHGGTLGYMLFHP